MNTSIDDDESTMIKDGVKKLQLLLRRKKKREYDMRKQQEAIKQKIKGLEEESKKYGGNGIINWRQIVE